MSSQDGDIYVWLRDDLLVWKCPRCGKRHIREWIPMELSGETLQQLHADGEDIGGESVYAYKMPDRVKCRGCGDRYCVANHIESDVDDE